MPIRAILPSVVFSTLTSTWTWQPFLQNALQWSFDAHSSVSGVSSISVTAPASSPTSTSTSVRRSEKVKTWSDITISSGWSASNIERAAIMLEAWPRFHDASHHTNSIVIFVNDSRAIASCITVAAWPSVTTTRSIPTDCSPLSSCSRGARVGRVRYTAGDCAIWRPRCRAGRARARARKN